MKKPLKIAAVCGLLSFILSVILFFYWISVGITAQNMFLTFAGIAGGVLGFFYLYGFVSLAKRFHNKLLLVMAWIGIAVTVLFTIIGLISAFVGPVQPVSAQEAIPALAEGVPEITAAFILAFLVFWIIICLIAGAYSILFGVGVLRMKDKVQYAKVAGVLEIIAGATYIIFVGFIVRFVATVIEIALLYKASEKYEK